MCQHQTLPDLDQRGEKYFCQPQPVNFLKLAFVLPLIYKDWWQRNHPTGRIRYKNIPVPKHTSIILALQECNPSEDSSVEHAGVIEELLMVLFQRMWRCCKAQTETTLMLGLWAIVLLFFSARRESNEVGPQSCSLWAPLGLNLKWAPATETWNSVRSTGHYVNKGNVGRLCGANVITLRMKQMKHNLILRSGFLQEWKPISIGMNIVFVWSWC